MSYSNYPNGFMNGITVRGLPLLQLHPGKVFWVNNSSVLADGGIGGSNTPGYGTYQKPFSTIDYAIGRCKAGRGDIIAVMPGHTETITAADAIDLDVAGVAIVGCGTGSLRPRLDYTAGAGEIAIGADNCTIHNINFHANVDSVLIGLDIETGVDYATVSNCLFDVETTGTDEFDLCIRLTNNNTGCEISDNVFEMGLADAVAAIKLDADTHRTHILRNVITGDYSTANINGDTTLSTELLLKDNIMVNGSSTDVGTEPVLELLTNTTGVAVNNTGFCNVATVAAAWVGDKIFHDRTHTGEVAGPGETTTLTSATMVAHADG